MCQFHDKSYYNDTSCNKLSNKRQSTKVGVDYVQIDISTIRYSIRIFLQEN